MRYRWSTGSIAWLLHRISGVALTLYIFLHLYVLSTLRDPERFQALMTRMDVPLVRAGEAGLLLLVIIHALNGIRLTLLDMGIPTRVQKTLFWSGAVIGGLLFLSGLYTFTGGAH